MPGGSGRGAGADADGHATRWWHLPRWKRAAHRAAGMAGAVLATWGFVVNPLVTGLVAAALAFIGLSFAVWRALAYMQRRKHRRTWLHPLHLAAHEIAGHPRAMKASAWISTEPATTAR